MIAQLYKITKKKSFRFVRLKKVNFMACSSSIKLFYKAFGEGEGCNSYLESVVFTSCETLGKSLPFLFASVSSLPKQGC